MKNPQTTVPGIMLLVAGILTVLGHFILAHGFHPSLVDLIGLISALGGIAHIGAQDGSA